MLRTLLASLAMAVLVCPASGAAVTGQISIFGSSNIDPVAKTITFLSGDPFQSMGPRYGQGAAGV
jgi:hypothetical protein